MSNETLPFHFSPRYFHFVFSFHSEIYNQRPLAPLTANHPTSATNPEHRSAVANNTTSVRRSVSGRSSSVLTSTPEKPNTITITTSATRPAPGKTICDIRVPGRRESAVAATIAATVTNNTLGKTFAPCTESIPLCCAMFSTGPPIRTPARNSRRDTPSLPPPRGPCGPREYLVRCPRTRPHSPLRRSIAVAAQRSLPPPDFPSESKPRVRR